MTLRLVVSDEVVSAPSALRAKAERALQRARSDYAGSNFGGCIERLRATEQSLQARLGVPPDAATLGVLRRVNLWLGLCTAVTPRPARADHHFARAALLSGDPPSARLFPPPVMARYRRVVAASRKRASCRVGVRAQRVWVDGRRVRGGDQVAIGEHYLAWRLADGRVGSARQSIGKNCIIAPAAGRLERISRAHAADPRFLERFGRSAGADRLRLVDPAGGPERQRVFDVTRGRFVETAGPSDAVRPAASAAAAPPVRDEQPGRAKPWYKRWWVWAIVGGVVVSAGAAATAAYLLRTTQYAIRF